MQRALVIDICRARDSTPCAHHVASLAAEAVAAASLAVVAAVAGIAVAAAVEAAAADSLQGQ